MKFNFCAQCIMVAYSKKNAWQILKPIFSQNLIGIFLFVAYFYFTRFFGEISFQCTVYNDGIFLKKISQMPLHGNYQVQCFQKTHMNLPLISFNYIFGEFKSPFHYSTQCIMVADF
jgi:hypothetical protein